MLEECPDCGAPIIGSRCKCGWRDPNSRPLADPDAHRCAYSHAGERCPALGVVTVNDGSQFYCWPHRDAIYSGDFTKCRLVLEDYQRNGIPKRPDWRAKQWAQHERDDPAWAARVLEARNKKRGNAA